MKYLGLLSVILLAGCQSTPTFCQKNPDTNLCNPKNYQYNTQQALKTFETKPSKKAFALAQTPDGWEFYGFSEGYRSSDKAKKRALAECQKQLDKRGIDGQCQLIR